MHLVSGLPSVFNTVINRSHKLTASAVSSSSALIADVFHDAAKLVYTSTGFNFTHGKKFWKEYNDSDVLLSRFIFDVKLYPLLNSSLVNDINYICCS